MSKQNKTRLIKYLCASLVSLAMAIFYISVRHIGLETRMEQYRIICDAFTVPGVVLVMFGMLMWISGTGALDGISYALHGLKSLIPGLGAEKLERYGDYVERKRGKRPTGYGFLFVVGGVCLAIALVFMFLFYQLYGK